MSTLLALIVGMFIGWNLPQPPWAKTLQEKVLALVRSFGGGSRGR